MILPRRPLMFTTRYMTRILTGPRTADLAPERMVSTWLLGVSSSD